jgi:hypothetical protein
LATSPLLASFESVVVLTLARPSPIAVRDLAGRHRVAARERLKDGGLRRTRVGARSTPANFSNGFSISVQ